jgi:phage gp29-like protein
MATKNKVTAKVTDKNAESPIVVVGDDGSLPKSVKSATPPKPAKKKKPINKPDDFSRKPIATDDLKDRILDLYVAPTTQWSVQSAIAALDNHERGNFSTSGRLADNMLRDPRIGSVIDTRVLGVLGLPFEWKFDKDPTPQDMGALEILQESWHHMFMDSVAAQVLRNTIIMGYCLVNNYWDEVDGYFIPKLTVWHPANAYYNIGTRKLSAFTYNQSVVEMEAGDYRWMVFKLLDHERPWMSGAIRRLAFSYLARTYAMNDWRTNSAVYGNPIRKLMTTMEAAAQPDTYTFIKDMADRIRMGAPIALPFGFDLQQLESTQHSPEMFKMLIDKCDTDIAISVLGQNLTTEVKSGSYAAANIHRDIMLEYLQADVNLLNKTVYHQLILPFYQFNFGEDIQIPHPHWDATIPEDTDQINEGLLKRSQSLATLGDALIKLKESGFGDMLNMTEIAREFRIPLNVKYNTPTTSE